MAYPRVERLELPLLQELVATGGAENVRFLYARLVAYFPQLDAAEVQTLASGHRKQWRLLVQRAGLQLDEQRQIERHRGQWSITPLGRRRVADEALDFSLTDSAEQTQVSTATLTHGDVQQMLLDIARALGLHAQKEFEYYDVVWRMSADSPRLSHVFEVQHKGNIDAALAKLKRAYEAQRSKPFLIIASERDTNRAQRSMSRANTGAFHEIGGVTAILSFEQLHRLHRALTSVEDLLTRFFE
jgi:hypothetical protein